MKTWLKIENGRQTDIVSSVSKPSGSGWHKAGADFDISRPHTLDNGTLRPLSDDEIAAIAAEGATSIFIDKVRYLDLLGPAAVAFKVAIRNPDTPIEVAATLEVAQEYLNAATELDLKSDRIKGFLSQLEQVGILTAEDVVRISANQTADEASAE